MTASSLRKQSCKELAQMARAMGLPGWHSMRKDELVKALVSHSRRKSRQSASTANMLLRDGIARSNGSAAGKSKVDEKLRRLRSQFSELRRIASTNGTEAKSPAHDRLVVMVRNPYWLHAHWELSPQSVERAQSALGQHWHATRPVLRLFVVAADGATELQREIPIHGGVSHWYVDVQNPPQQYRMEIGYLTAGGQFYCLARSNSVTTPPAGTSDAVDENWADIDQNADRIFAMSGGYSQRGTSLELQELLEERLRRPMGNPMQTRYGGGASRVLVEASELPFAVDAELVIFGVSDPHAHVTLQGEPVPLRPDGSFTVRMSLPDRRQVIPVISSSSDGVEQRTIILAVERNTKVLGRVLRDAGA
ncbi:MAG TPA: DUF4912 domain-containing protein [Lacipirellulaceae bacterium]|nr:DUF4912 domain-containing protein [Lacipirellulaceae bacterium]